MEALYSFRQLKVRSYEFIATATSRLHEVAKNLQIRTKTFREKIKWVREVIQQYQI